jgi:hypothetical protein
MSLGAIAAKVMDSLRKISESGFSVAEETNSLFGVVEVEPRFYAFKAGFVLGQSAIERSVFTRETGDLKAQFKDVLLEFEHFGVRFLSCGANAAQKIENEVVGRLSHAPIIQYTD